MKKLRLFSLATITIFALVFMASPAFAWTINTSTKTIHGTTVRWNSSFVDTSYTCADISLTQANLGITIISGTGSVSFAEFISNNKTFTPKDVTGDSDITTDPSEADITIDSLHYDAKRDPPVWIGNVHLKWQGSVDGATIKGGVNIHVESDDDCGS